MPVISCIFRFSASGKYLQLRNRKFLSLMRNHLKSRFLTNFLESAIKYLKIVNRLVWQSPKIRIIRSIGYQGPSASVNLPSFHRTIPKISRSCKKMRHFPDRWILRIMTNSIILCFKTLWPVENNFITRPTKIPRKGRNFMDSPTRS